jgi:hypothetical protein
VDSLDLVRQDLRSTLIRFDDLIAARRSAIERKEAFLSAVETGIRRGGHLYDPAAAAFRSQQNPEDDRRLEELAGSALGSLDQVTVFSSLTLIVSLFVQLWFYPCE